MELRGLLRALMLLLMVVNCDGYGKASGGSPSKANPSKVGGGNSSPFAKIIESKCGMPQLMNGRVSCSYSSTEKRCTGTCREGYSFGGTTDSVEIVCYSDGTWTPSANFPSCEPNAGTGTGHGYPSGAGSSSSKVTGEGHPSKTSGGDTSSQFSQLLDYKCGAHPQLMNGRVSCSKSSTELRCVGTCRTGYGFGGSSHSKELVCYSDGTWMPSSSFPTCEAMCDPPCTSAGTCVGSNYCRCEKGYWGPTCESSVSICDINAGRNLGAKCNYTQDLMTCMVYCPVGMTFDFTPDSVYFTCDLMGRWNPSRIPSCVQPNAGHEGGGNYEHGGGGNSGHGGSAQSNDIEIKCGSVPQLMNGRVSCTRSATEMRCTGTCRTGYQFGKNKNTKEIVCYSDGTWTPSATFPTCKPICDPPCENAGKCMGHNYCRCPKGFWGRLCESSISICNIHENRNLGAKCNYTNELMTCVVHCPTGMTFDSPPDPAYYCDPAGRWNPSVIPNCVTTNTIPEGGHHNEHGTDLGPGAHTGGSTNEIEVKCGTPPQLMNGRVSCTRTATEMKCTGTCRTGYQFYTGSNTKELVCYRDGSWTPDANFPECRPICDPPCQNGGVCSGHNYCVCPSKFWGSSCEILTSICNLREHSNAGRKCNFTNDLMSCTLHCPDGMIFNSYPSQIYHCDTQGRWDPYDIPSCIPVNEEIIATTPHAQNQMTVTTASDTLRNGRCITWERKFFQTFDGRLYEFEGGCTYLLAKDCSANSFAIYMDMGEECNKDYCHVSVIVYLDNELFTIKQEDGYPALYLGKHQISIPMSANNIIVQRVAHNVVLFSNSGFRLLWDGKLKVQIDVDTNFFNKTCGLCGRYDGGIEDDFEAADGMNALTVVEFADSWKVDNLGADCQRTFMPKNTCESLPEEEVAKILSYCKRIKNPEFASCLHFVDPDPYIEMCVSEYCACHDTRDDCGCTALSAYFKECMRLGGTLENEWRTKDFCHVKCENGMEYRDCGSDCPGTCANPHQECSTNWCLDGCFCPEGMLLGSDGKCFEADECPCTYQNKDHLPGSVIWQDCNSCQCAKGHWICSEEVCEARCSSIGDPHYVTFDGKHYDFMGKCSYYLVSNANYSIEQENVACDGSISKAAGYSAIEQVLRPSCTKTVTIRTKGSELHLKQDHSMVLNGRELTELPHFSPGMYIYMPSGSFIKIVLKNGLSVMWDGETRLYIDAPPALMGTLRGLCGTFSLSQKDDFHTPEGDIEKNVESFANKWKTDDFCDDVPMSSTEPHPCSIQPHLEEQAKHICNKIKSKLFSDCHDLVESQAYFDNCMYDLCACKDSQVENCFCPTIADYAAICAKKGAIIEWRQRVTECEVTCSPGQVFSQCGSSCRRSCKNIASNTKCVEQCVEGCNCPDGHTLDENGRCIPESDCPCLYNDREYDAGYIDIRDALECVCHNAKWKCKPATAERLSEKNTTSPCSEEDNLEGTDCVLECPLTCSNYHKPPICETVHCKPGCQCKHGYIYDPKQKKCVHPGQCPCHHNDRSYKDGESIQQDCNFCLCAGGQWKCEKKDCVGICNVWGKTHYKTFDGRMFEFESECEFTLVQGSLSSGDQFTINVQNKPCGGADGACYKSVTFMTESEEVLLVKDTPLPEPSIETGIVVREIGLFVVVHTNFGVSLYWDRGSRVYVKLHSRWKSHVEGLCGDYNDNEMDDFRSSLGGPVIVRPTMFAESWKVKPYCPPIAPAVDACEVYSHRKPWAVKKCAVLTSDLFADCHSEVPVYPFLEACIADTCGCDGGDDCQCTCTAIAAYAQECSVFGKPIEWRSQELCPIQCRECDKYTPCMSVCPKTTCETEFLYKDISATCQEEMCVEGCDPPLCAENEIYEDDKEFKCIPKAECSRQPCAVINGKRYHEGERISDPKVALPCQSCHCMNGKLTCVGEPCASTPPPPPVTVATPPPVIEEPECNYDPFWSDWISSYIPTYDNGGDYEIIADLVKGSYNLCPLEYNTAIECRTVGSSILSSKSGDFVHCDLPKGLICENSDQQPEKLCRDYEIRLYCDCEKNKPPITTEAPSVTSRTTNREEESIYTSKPPVLCLTPGWTKWMTDDSGKNDILSLRDQYPFCPQSDIINVECREISTKKPSTLFPDVICDINRFDCLKLDKTQCPELEIRYDCRCEDAPCDAKLGMENGDIKNDQITASSFVLSKAARLNGQQAWSPEILSNDEWIQVELEEIQEITGILTQGSPKSKEWVTHYQVQYSVDGYDWKFVEEGGQPVDFIGNEDNESMKRNDFSTAIYAKFIKIIPKDWIYGISLRFELLGCNRLEHKMVTPPVTIIPTTTPRPECIKTGWTDWFNIDSPDNDMEPEVNANKFGDYELISHLRRHYSFCLTPSSIQCQTADTKIASHETGQKVTCDYDTGLACENSEEKCHDYEIRLYCNCGEITTPYPTTLSTTPSTRKLCPSGSSGFTEWMSVSDPVTEPEGDIESMEELREMYEFCKPEYIMGVECRTVDSHVEYTKSGQINLKCDPQEGFRCEHSQQNYEICLDYEVRFFCLCVEDIIPTSPRTTPGPSVLAETYSTIIPTHTTGAICDAWSGWINLSPPSYEIEEELVANIPNFYNKCPRPTSIKCRHAVDKNDYTEYPELILNPSCTLEGIRCDNEENNNMCPDFEINVYCECAPETTPLPVATIPPVCSPGWTEWFDIGSPENEKGDFERIDDLRQRYEFCSAHEITDVRCEAIDHPDIAFGGDVTDFKTKLGLVSVKCNKEFGLECFNNMQPSQMCLDYKISIHCYCKEPIVEETTPAAVIPICNEWTEWIDNDGPMDGVEEELFSSISNFDQLCPVVDSVECVESNSELPYTAFGLEKYLDEPCTQRGIKCTGENCQDFKIRAHCTCEGVTTVVPSEVCESGWTEWFNIDDPNSDDGDFELMEDLRKRYQFCNKESIINVECSTADTFINYHDTGDESVKCNKFIGLVCYNNLQASGECHDYRIRFECSCGEETTAIETTPPPVTPICNEWTEWIDNDNPMDEIEEEFFSTVSNFNQLCPNIESVECVEANSELPYNNFGLEKYLEESCTDRGIRCVGKNCRDFKIRAFCTCEGVTTVKPPEVCENGWTEWFNIDDPYSDDGDFELMEDLRQRYQFCNESSIVNVECSTADTLIDFRNTGDESVKCNKFIGSVCYNNQQTLGECHDYRIRFECSCEPTTRGYYTLETSPSTTIPPKKTTPYPTTPAIRVTTPSTTPTTTVSICPDGYFWDDCAYSCDRMCHSFLTTSQQSGECPDDVNNEYPSCIGGCVTELCESPQIWRDKHTCVMPEECTCISAGGVILGPGEVIDVSDCERCQCLKDDLICEAIPGCGTSETTIPPITASTPLLPVTPVEQPDCWTLWLSADTPDGYGDSETFNKLRARYEFCADPIKIECRVVDTYVHVEDTGESVTCDVDNGLLCRNTREQRCSDYEVRFYCPCENFTTVLPPITREITTTLPPFIPTGTNAPCKKLIGLVEYLPDENLRASSSLSAVNGPRSARLTSNEAWTPVEQNKEQYLEIDLGSVQPVYGVVTSGHAFKSEWVKSYHILYSDDGVKFKYYTKPGELTPKLLPGNYKQGLPLRMKFDQPFDARFVRIEPQSWNGQISLRVDILGCAEISTITPTSTPTTPATEKITTKPVPVSPGPCVQGYTQWFSAHEPDATGEYEQLVDIRNQGNSLCASEYITAMQCRDVRSKTLADSSRNRGVVCDLNLGFYCKNEDQLPGEECDDYEVRYLCDCPTSPPPVVETTTTKKETETPTTKPGIYTIAPTESTIITYTPIIPPPTVPPCKKLVGLVDYLPDENLKASGSLSPSTGPQYARLTSNQAWTPKEQNKNQYLEIDLGQSQPVYGIVTSGHATKPEWVKTYRILYSRDGITYTYYTKPGEATPKSFPGNYKENLPLRLKFDQPFMARYIRMQPWTWNGQISLRADILGCAEEPITTTTTVIPTTVRDCDEPMGFEDNTLDDRQISVSTYYDEFHGPGRIRLNTEETQIGAGGWLAEKLDTNQFVQIDFTEIRTLTGIVTQGREGDKHQYVTSYKVQYSNNGKTWHDVVDENGNTEIFRGNYDEDTPVTNYFYQPVRARYLRIVPQTWNNWIAMRIEIRGCYEPYATISPAVSQYSITTERVTTVELTSPTTVYRKCDEPMGIENGGVGASQITVSSSLHETRSDGSRIGLNQIEDEDTGGWLAGSGDIHPFVEFDFLQVVNLSGIVTLGREKHNEWVSEYEVEYSIDGYTWEPVLSENYNKKFEGNTDSSTAVTQYFEKIIHTRYLRISPTNWHNWVAMRVEILGCLEVMATTVPTPTDCIEYGPWINNGKPYIADGDFETISKLITESNMCKNPIEIECRQAVVTHLDYRAAGQRVTCDLGDGLVCRNSDQQRAEQCYDYEARIGCYVCPPVSTPVSTPAVHGVCPEVPKELYKYCPDYCPEGELCDGQKCVSPLHCACFVDGKKFYPGDKIVRSNCEECECQLDGQSNCAKKTCSPCGKGLISLLDEDNCRCKCEPCPDGTVLCPTSKICIPEEKWCDGTVDCPDDEIDCVTTAYPTTAATCPPVVIPSCSTGMTFVARTTDPDKKCVEYFCEPIKTTTTTTTTTTPAPIRTTTTETPIVPVYVTTCEMYSTFFKTFDHEEFPYDICDHILMQDKNEQKYSATVHKVCTDNFKSCHKYLQITQDGHVIRLNSDLSIEYKGQRYSGAAQLRALGKTVTDFTLRTAGSVVKFKSNVYGFEVEWSKQEYVKINVGEKLLYKINGLCGFYNHDPKDDFEKPDGSRAISIQDFGDSWSIGPLDQCNKEVCLDEIKVKAVAVCNNLISPPLDECNSHVDPAFYLSACVVSMCECLNQEQKSAKECECEAYITYVEACKQKAPSVKLNEWRTKLGCAPTCPPGLVWKDCGPSCERYCENLQEDLSDCDDSCIAGCYCPDGTVKKRNDTCVPPEKCQDCICDGYGDPHYTTFDRQYYPFQGNCTYILAQDKSPTGEPTFQVMITNDECVEEPDTTCTTAILLVYNGHVAHFRVNQSITVDGVQLRPSDFPLEYEGIKISVTNRPGRIITFTVDEIFLEVRYYENNYGFQVRLPSEIYYNQTEGLCGNCNFDVTDDLTTSDGVITNDTDRFGHSWLATPPKEMEIVNNRCVVHPPKICNDTTVTEKCKTLLGHQFKPCHLLVDPDTVFKACEFDVCHSVNPENSLCRALTEYARACAQVGVCVQNWRTPKLCPMQCPEGMYFDQCGPGCTHTCANKDEYTNVNEQCDLDPVEGCFCIGDRIIKDEMCVDPIECETCDEEGHGVGDTWKPEACTSCACKENLVIECVKIQCPSKPICKADEDVICLQSNDNPCCEECSCSILPPSPCPEIEMPSCNPGEVAKPVRGDDNCIYRTCECDITQCPPVKEPVLAEKGHEVVVDKSGCCPTKIVICNKEKCPSEVTCPRGEFLETYNEHKCCPESRCVPPRDQCFYHYENEITDTDAHELGNGDALHPAGDSWMDGKCIKCMCDGSPGQYTAVCEKQSCEPPNKYITDNYAIDKVDSPDKCCPAYRRIVCLVNGTKYSSGETWPSEDGDKCKKHQCADSPTGDVVKTTVTTTCKTDCPAGFLYQYPPDTSPECCGQCKPSGCVEMGYLYDVGEEWESKTKKCAQATCVNDSSIGLITQYKTTCLPFPINCPYDKIGRDDDDCCDICTVEPIEETCAAKNVNVTETIGLFQKYINNQLCTNSKPIADFKECIGTCESYSIYSSGKGDFESNCLCCTPDGTETKIIYLDCADGSESSYSYKQPTSCSCTVCTGINEEDHGFIAATQ